MLRTYFSAQCESRHLDFAARWLQSNGRGYYTIGSAGHESNAAVALALRHTDPALLHYRSGGFYAARATQLAGTTPIDDVLLGMMSAQADQISGGRHKVFGHRRLSIIPQTSTIGSHAPRAVGLAYALDRPDRPPSEWPTDALVVCSFGDASLNHSTTVGALNAAAHTARRGIGLPLLVVCEDNGIGISTPSQPDWVETALRSLPCFRYAEADGFDALALLDTTAELVDYVRTSRRPAVLHLKTVRFMGHAGSDAEIGYRSHREIVAEFARDPLLGAARALLDAGLMSPQDIEDVYRSSGERVMARARALIGMPQLESREEVIEPIAMPVLPPQTRTWSVDVGAATAEAIGTAGTTMTLAQCINSSLAQVLERIPQSLVFGEDVAKKGGVYGVTRGLARRFGNQRVFNTLLDEQSILGLALGSALAGYLPIPEIQYLAYLHNAADQVRGEAATLAFFSNGQYSNGVIIRIAGLAYQKGFGGHFHNDNSLSALRDIPGLILAVPSYPAAAAGLYASCVRLARAGRVCVVVEPIALYHTRDLYSEGDGAWAAAAADRSVAEAADRDVAPLGSVNTFLDGRDLLIITYGNGVRMSLRAAAKLRGQGVHVKVLDLQWLLPLPREAIAREAAGYQHVLVVDEGRASAGVAESVMTELVESGYDGRVQRVCSADSFIPLGPSADLVLMSEQDIVTAVEDMVCPSRLEIG